MKEDVEQTSVLQFQWHVVVHLIDCQFHVQSHHHLVACIHHGDGSHLFFLLHRQQQVLLALLQSEHGVRVAQNHLSFHANESHHRDHQYE